MWRGERTAWHEHCSAIVSKDPQSAFDVRVDHLIPGDLKYLPGGKDLELDPRS
jgi:hypothetical protein